MEYVQNAATAAGRLIDDLYYLECVPPYRLTLPPMPSAVLIISALGYQAPAV